MNKWQKFKHFFKHHWHTVTDFEDTVVIKGHGMYSPYPKETATFIKQICCWCGKEKIKRRYESNDYYYA